MKANLFMKQFTNFILMKHRSQYYGEKNKQMVKKFTWDDSLLSHLDPRIK